ncbi:MAG: hypothetical protein PHT94_03220 [Candidatus Nanoarchaeia archaeon]|nr:hypothetical protein [Candidatus Nanoarchaeia archaeon]
MAQKRKTTERKIIKRKWFPIISPELFGAKEIGDTYTADYESKVSKTVDINGMFATGNMRQQNINYTLEIVKAENQELRTIIKGANLLSSYVKRIVRKNSSRVDDSFVIKTKDNKYVRIKPILLTKFNVVESTQRLLRLGTKQKLLIFGLESTYDDLTRAIYKSDLQKDLVKLLSNICPIKFFEIREYQLLSSHVEKKNEFDIEEIKKIVELTIKEKKSEEKSKRPIVKEEKEDKTSE